MNKRLPFIALLTLSLSGCAARKNVGSPGRINIPADCITEMKPGPQGCYVSSSGKAVCPNVLLTRHPDCERLEVQSKNKSKSK